MIEFALIAALADPIDPEELRRWEEQNIVVVSRQPFLNVFVVDEEEWEAAKMERRRLRRANREQRRARRAARRDARRRDRA